MTGPLAAPGFLRVWIAGGIANALLWLEVLAGSLFTLAVTGSPLDVALVSAARAAPLLLVGAFVGVLADAWNRKVIVVGGLLLAAASSAGVAGLALAGVLRPWHVAVAALVSGLVYATEMPARRRLVAELAGPAMLERAVALDSLTNFATRVAGPLLGGVAAGTIGIGATFAVSAALSLSGALLVAGIAHRQVVRRLNLRAAWADLREGLAAARASRAIATLLAVTVVMNLLGYSYTTLLAPLGRALHLTDAAVGVLGAAEPAGALLGGLAMVGWRPRGAAVAWLGGGVAMLLAALSLVPLLPPLVPVCAMLLLGGLGSGMFTNMQTVIAVDSAAPALRSRVLGLVSMCIGCWPLGQVLTGAVAERVGAVMALPLLAIPGLLALAVIAVTAPRRAALAP